MPKVGKKHFSYSKKGKAAAKKYAKKTKKKVKHKKNPGYYVENAMNEHQLNLLGESVWNTYKKLGILIEEKLLSRHP